MTIMMRNEGINLSNLFARYPHAQIVTLQSDSFGSDWLEVKIEQDGNETLIILGSTKWEHA